MPLVIHSQVILLVIKHLVCKNVLLPPFSSFLFYEFPGLYSFFRLFFGVTLDLLTVLFIHYLNTRIQNFN